MRILNSALKRTQTNYEVTFFHQLKPFKSLVNDNDSVFIHTLWYYTIFLSSTQHRLIGVTFF